MFWTQGSSEELFRASFLSIGDKANLSTGTASGDEIVIRDWLDSAESGQWILIVDNVDEANDVRSLLPMNRGSIVFTTSDRSVAVDLVDASQEIQVSSMTLAEATSLCFRLTSMPSIQEKEAEDLAGLLGGFPLAIIQAFACMRHHSMSISKYARQIRERINTHLSSSSSLERLLPKSAREAHILEAWDMSYKPLTATSEFAAKLLQAFSLLSAQPIPRKILSPDTLKSLGASSDEDIDQALSLLVTLAFVSVSGEDDERVYQLHSLVILWVRTKIADGPSIANTAFDIVMDSFPTTSQNTVKDRAEGAIIVSHAQSIESYCDAHTSVDRGKAMKLKSKIGRYFSWYGSYVTAEKCMRTCIEFYTDRQESSRGLATCYVILGTALQGRCEFAEAIECYDKAYDIRREILGAEHLSTLDILGDKAATLYSQGNMHGALTAYRATYESVIATPENAETSSARLCHLMSGMALVYCKLGDFTSASKWYSEALELAIKAHGYEHPKTWTLVTGQVDMLYKLGKHQKATKIFSEAVEAIAKEHATDLGTTGDGTKESSLVETLTKILPIIRRIMGQRHGSTIGYMDFLGSQLMEEGRHKEALSWFKNAYELSVEVFGIKNLASLDIAHNMSMVYIELGDQEAADKYIDISLEGSIKLLGRDHHIVLSSMCEKAFSLIDRGEDSEALKLLVGVHATQVRKLGPEHENTLSTLGAMAEAHTGLGQQEAALECFQTALSGYSKSEAFNTQSPALVDTQQNLAELLMDMGRNDEALGLLSQVISVRKDKGRLHYAKSMLGTVMVRVGQEEGLEIARNALEALEKMLPDTLGFMDVAVVNFAECLRLQGRLSDALALCEKQPMLDHEMKDHDSPSVVKLLIEKGDVLVRLKKREQGLEAYRRAHDVSEAHLGLDHPLTTKTAERYANLAKTKETTSYDAYVVFPTLVAISACWLLYVKHRRG